MHSNTSSIIGASALQLQSKDNNDIGVNNFRSSSSSGTSKRTSSSSVSSSSSLASSSTTSDNDEDASSSELVPIAVLHKERSASQAHGVKSQLKKASDSSSKTRNVETSAINSSPSALVAPKPKIRLSLKLPVSKQGGAKKTASSSSAAASAKELSLNKPKTVRSKGPTFATVATVVPSMASSKAKTKTVENKLSSENLPLLADLPKAAVEKKRKAEVQIDAKSDSVEQNSGGKKKKTGSPKGTSGTRRKAASSSPSQPALEGDTSQMQSQQQQQAAVTRPQYLFTGGMDIPSMKLSLQSPGLVIHPSMAMSSSSASANASSVAAYRQQVTSSTAATTVPSAGSNAAVGGGGVTSSSALSTHALHSEKTSAASIFTNAMKNIGYMFPSFSSAESATEESTPQVEVELTHRGSSTVRSVQDIFDRWIPGKEAKMLLPKEFYLPAPALTGKTVTSDDNGVENEDPPLVDRFLKSFSSCLEDVHGRHRVEQNDMDSCIPQLFESMLPVSLNIGHSEEYISKYQQYVRDVQTREQCIISYQKQYNEYQYCKDKIEDRKRQQSKSIKQEDKEDRDGGEETKIPTEPEYIEIPPIPKPPCVSSLDLDETLLPPIHLVRHLDYPLFFQSKTAPYFGLTSNTIVDPQYVGANAPGLLGLIHLLSGNMQDGTFYSAVPSYASGGPGSSKEKGAQLLPSTGKGKKIKGKKGKAAELSVVKQEKNEVSSPTAIAAEAATT